MLSNAEMVKNAIQNAAIEGCLRNIANDSTIYGGDQVTIKNNKVVNFGSCSYLGIELDQRIKDGMQKMVEQYGSMLSSSPIYLRLEAYDEAERLLSEVFGHDAILSSTCTLGHLANIPVLIGANDLVLLDAQVHNSVVTATTLAATNGCTVRRIRHSRVDLLAQELEQNKDKYDKIWYMADGVYSMYGDVAPVHQVYELMNQYPNFYFYVDDAHGMGWTGKNGTGYILGEVDYHPQMVFVSSLAKGVAAAGGVTIIQDPDLRDAIRYGGNTHIFAGPIPPAMLGALNASLKILLSNDVNIMQDELQQKMNFFTNRAKEYNIPIVEKEVLTPVYFAKVGSTASTYKMFHILKEAGYYINTAFFPAVPQNKAGLRIPITNHHSFEQIDGLLSVIAENLPLVLEQEKLSLAI
jgi:7-keto-8-aminopelargonate synthetase-like enzyme